MNILITGALGQIGSSLISRLNEIKKYETMGGYYLNNHTELSVSKDLWKNILNKIDDIEPEQEPKSYVSHSIQSNIHENKIKIPSFLSIIIP